MRYHFSQMKVAMDTVLLAGVLLSAGCKQMTLHSNTLVFATDTSAGVKVGQSTNQTPTIEIGYNRQEAAFVPLLANTGSDGGNLSPCPAGPAAMEKNTTIDISNCLFVATDSNGKSKDSYSTIASFGSKLTAGGTQGEVAIAQYFATGLAAQNLALSGGANIVQAGGDTKAKAEAASSAADSAALVEKAKIQAAVDEKDDAIDKAADALQVKVDSNGNGNLEKDEIEKLNTLLPNAAKVDVDDYINRRPSKLIGDIKRNIPFRIDSILKSWK